MSKRAAGSGGKYMAVLCVLLGCAAVTSLAAGNGYFTREQALRGKTQFLASCAACHADNLQGIGSAPALAGAAFLARWSNSNAGELFDRIRTTMPQNAPASLAPAAYADLTAYVLRANNFPVGERELPADGAVLGKYPLTGGRP
jgi:mono/diheme cytochrome c family protein